MSTGDGRPLLIIEDDAAALRQLRWTFDAYEVSTACDREEAREALFAANAKAKERNDSRISSFTPPTS